ncbi:MAG: RICIN domain-containing protein, partial [Bryobacteraceae bacterium]
MPAPLPRPAAVLGALLLVLPFAARAQSSFISDAQVQRSGLCLEVPGASTATGVQLVQNTCNGRAEQSFDFQV